MSHIQALNWTCPACRSVQKWLICVRSPANTAYLSSARNRRSVLRHGARARRTLTLREGDSPVMFKMRSGSGGRGGKASRRGRKSASLGKTAKVTRFGHRCVRGRAGVLPAIHHECGVTVTSPRRNCLLTRPVIMQAARTLIRCPL
jgi:hypothetical protein